MAKKEEHYAIECLPYKGRSVIVRRNIKGEPPFAAYMTIKGDNLIWIGTCGTYKDKEFIIDVDDKWYYEQSTSIYDLAGY